jgi:hypothetical protein
MLNQSGKVLVRFRDASKASEFERTANERILGGNKIRAEKVSAKSKERYSDSSQVSSLLAGGRGTNATTPTRQATLRNATTIAWSSSHDQRTPK